jgi:predicted transcriptional regulator
MDIQLEIYQFIRIEQKRSNNKSGINPTTIMQEFSIELKYLKTYLNSLHKEGKIKVRKGINNNLIFLP